MPITWPERVRPESKSSELGQAEIADLGDSLGGQEDIARLEVAMDDPGRVGGMDGAREGLGQRGGLARGHGLLGQPLGEAAALGEFQREIGAMVVLADGVDGDDVRMSQPGDGVGFGPKPFDLLLGRELTFDEGLEGHEAAELPVVGLEDDPHGPPAQFIEELQAVDHRARAGFGRPGRRRSPREAESSRPNRGRGTPGRSRHRPRRSASGRISASVGKRIKVLARVGTVAPEPSDSIFRHDELRRDPGRTTHDSG